MTDTHDGVLARTLTTPPAGLTHGIVQSMLQANPAAGAVFTRSCLNDYWEQLMSVTFTFTTSAVVANRTVFVDLLDADGNLVIRNQVTGVVVASTSLVVSSWLGATSQNRATTVASVVPLWSVVMRPGWQIKISAVGMDAGDTFTAIVLLVARYPSKWADGALTAEHIAILRDMLDRISELGVNQ